MKFHDIVECVELDQHYREKLNLEGDSLNILFFFHHNIRRILMLCHVRNGSFYMIPRPHEP